MEFNVKITPNDEIKLLLTDYDKENLRSAVVKEVVDKLASTIESLNRNISDEIVNKITKNYIDFIKREIDIKITEVVNAFSGGNYPHVLFCAETIEVFGEKIDAEEYVFKKWQALGYNSSYSKKSRLTIDDRQTIPEEAYLCLYEENKTGLPDLFVHKNNSYAFIEVKTNGDCLRPDQMLWIKNHPNITVIIFYLEQIIHTKDENEIINAQLSLKREVEVAP